MSKQIINIGSQSNDGTGDSIRDAFQKANQNFDELYSLAGAGKGLYFTKSLVDTPKTLTADTITNAASIIGVNTLGNSLTNKILIASTGISILSTGSYIYIANTGSVLSTDPNPTLGGNLAGGGYRATNFADPTLTQDLATKSYVDKNSFPSSINLFVSTSGDDTNDVTFGDPVTGSAGANKGGRALSYAFRTISKACQVAEKLVAQANIELGPDQKYITYGFGANQSRIQTITTSSVVPGNFILSVNYTGAGTDPWLENDIRPGQYVKGMTSGAVGFINYLYNNGTIGTAYEFYDVRVIPQTPPKAFQTNELLMYGSPVNISNISIMVESGIYEEHYPIKVPPYTSIRGDEFRRVIVRPKPGISASPWVRTWFYRDSVFDGLTIASTGTVSANGEGYFGYHYLTTATNINSTPKNNDQIDVFLMNDQTILRAFNCQGHGGFMMVLDPAGQILTKSPYIQNCSSLSKSINTQTFAGGMYIDGNAGILQSRPVNTTTYYTGTTTVSVTGLTIRQPQVPCKFIVNGIGYEIDYVENWNSSTGAAIFHLNPNNPGGVGSVGGIIPVNSGTGYTIVPSVQFSSPEYAGGVVAQGTATVSVGGVVTQINITNPGSGYTATPTVRFISNGSGSGATVTLSSSTVQKGYIGLFPQIIETGAAGYRSSLAADFTQLNDLGYGIVITNIAFAELVSVFAYFCHVAYYANNGGQIGSSNGAIKYGDKAMVSEGADRLEVPIPTYLVNDMVSTATVVNNANFWGLDTRNTATDTTLYVQRSDLNLVPNNQSILTVDYGAAVDAKGNKLGLQQYTITNANTVTNTATVIQLNLSTAAGAFGAIKASIPNGTPVIIRGNKSFEFSGVNAATISRPSTALTFNESKSIAYQVLQYDASSYSTGSGFVNATLKKPFSYIQLTPYTLPNSGATTIYINAPSTSTGVTTVISDSQRLVNSIVSATPTDNYIFGWNDTIHTITGFTWLGNNTATITITPGLTAGITTTTSVLYAGLKASSPAEITTRISILRATGQDFVDVGTGGRETSNIPNDVFGPPRIARSSTKEVTEVGKGRVFVTATDQDGNFRVGDLFTINQGTGAATLNAAITLTGVDGLGFSKGVLVDEFSTDEVMNPASGHIVPVQMAVANHVSRRLGLNVFGTPVSKLGSGYLDLTGIQQMTGDLLLYRDVTTSSSLLAATSRSYVDRIRQLNTLSDVTFTNPADGDILMLGGILAVNTVTNRPIWSSTNQVVNVANSSTSDISITRTNNSIDLQLRAGVIVNNDVNASAAIAQTKLSLNSAGVFSNQAGSVGNLGVVAFNQSFFTATNGFISMAAGPTNTANQVLTSNGTGVVAWTNITGLASSFAALTAGNYLATSPISTTYNGSAAVTFNVNATAANTVGAVVARDANGDFSARNITMTGISAGAQGTAGTITGQWTLVGTSTLNATYADLAENYTSDAEYAPGTVVIFGGDKEITISTEHMDRRVAGVISTNPAYTMNVSTLGATVALQGRVPCKVVGLIYKGDMLVSSGIPGVAMAEYNPKMGTVIGKALEDYHNTEVGTIEVVVGRL